MERAQDQMSGFGRHERGRDRLKIAHLPHKDDIGILPQCASQRYVKRLGVVSDLSLADNTLSVSVQKFDWIFDRYDIVRPVAVDVVDQRRQGGGFSASCR